MTSLSGFRSLWSGSTLVRVGAVLSLIALLSLSLIVAATVFAERSAGKASAINMAGSLRMQSYALSTRVADMSGEQSGRRAAAEAAVADFERRLRSPSLLAGIPDGPASPARHLYEEIVADWEARIRPMSQRALESEAARTDYLAAVPAFVGRLDELVQHIETDLESRIQHLRAVLISGVLVMLLLMAAALYRLNVEVFQPIARLADVARQVRTGDFTVRARSDGPDELGQLGQAFNFMIDDLARLYGSLEKQVAEKTRDLERRNESLALLYETTRTLAERPLDADSLARVLELTRKALGAEGGVICSMHDGATRGLPLVRDDAIIKACQGQDCGLCAGAAPLNWRAEPGPTGERRVIGIGLVDGGVRYGVMPLVLPPNRGLEIWQMELAETIGRHVGAALAAAERRDEHRRLGVLEERSAIARELHDSLAQSLSYSKIQIARLTLLLEQSARPPQAAAVLAELREGVSTAYRQLRELLTTFRLALGEEGVAGALRDACAEFERRSGVPATLVNDLARVELSANEQVHVLQIVREALTNIEHHAHARHASVSLGRAADGAIEVRVEDDGVGIGAAGAREGHFGLAIMRDRALLVGGELRVEARRPAGTRVLLRFRPQTAFAAGRAADAGQRAETTA